MNTFLTYLVLISMLFVSIEGAADMGKSGHAHDEHASLHIDPDEVGAAIPDKDASHCDHCCHGHINVIGSVLIPIHSRIPAGNQRPLSSLFVKNYAQAPPTPPPTA